MNWTLPDATFKVHRKEDTVNNPSHYGQGAIECIEAFLTRGRQRGGAGGQTIEATMRSTFHEISAYDLDTISEALAAQAARIAELEAGLDAMQDAYELRAELFTSDEDCAANLYDRIRLLIKKEGEDG